MFYFYAFLLFSAFAAWVEIQPARQWLARERAAIDALFTRVDSFAKIEQPQLYPAKSYPWKP